MSSPRSFGFGPFLLIPERQLLLRGDTPVRIGCRALDLLTALVERPGELVTKTELMARAWPSTIVEEANLKVNMSLLRHALGECVDAPNYIATVTGRGYRFVAPVQTNPTQEARLAAIVDPDGVGKSTVSIAVAESLIATTGDGNCEHVIDAVASCVNRILADAAAVKILVTITTWSRSS